MRVEFHTFESKRPSTLRDQPFRQGDLELAIAGTNAKDAPCVIRRGVVCPRQPVAEETLDRFHAAILQSRKNMLVRPVMKNRRQIVNVHAVREDLLFLGDSCAITHLIVPRPAHHGPCPPAELMESRRLWHSVKLHEAFEHVWARLQLTLRLGTAG